MSCIILLLPNNKGAGSFQRILSCASSLLLQNINAIASFRRILSCTLSHAFEHQCHMQWPPHTHVYFAFRYHIKYVSSLDVELNDNHSILPG